jgi:MFS family permease
MMHAFSGSGTGVRSKGLVLTAMIFAVAMTFIDQTIVSIAAPTIQHDLGLSSSGMQWAINAYLLALAALPRRGWWRFARCRARAGRSCSRPRSRSWW